MIKGIGVDLCGIERMRKAVERHGFKERVFSDQEISYAEGKADPASHYAASFAAKEALAKALGWGLGSMGVDSCSVVRTAAGPCFEFTGEMQGRLEKAGIGCVFLSLSHDGGMAVAMVVLEGCA